MTNEKIRERLEECRKAENKLNKEMSRLSYEIKVAYKKKMKLAIRVSKNMKYRNSLINQLK